MWCRVSLVGLAWVIAAPALAQPCHVAPESAAAASRAAGALLEAESAPAALHDGRPGFEALGVRLLGTFDRVAGFVAARGYRVSDGGQQRYGIGDLLAGGSVRVFGSGAAGGRAGLALGAWFPTAEPGSGLGGGHVMLMPSLWADRRWGRVLGRAAAGYGRALTSAAHGAHVHGQPAALVDPMNRSEVAASAVVEVPVFLHWAARAALLGAVAVRDEAGHSRALVGGDWRYQGPGYAFAATARWPLRGYDFGLRLGLIAEVAWGQLWSGPG